MGMVKTKSKLLKLLYEYSANRKLVDGKYIQELIEIVVDSKDIVDYAGGLIITDKDSRLRDPNSLLAVYYPNRKLIAVYLDAVEKMLKIYNICSLLVIFNREVKNEQCN